MAGGLLSSGINLKRLKFCHEDHEEHKEEKNIKSSIKYAEYEVYVLNRQVCICCLLSWNP